MNLTALGLGVFLLAFAGYLLGDPLGRARSWVPVREWRYDPAGAETTQRLRMVVYATAVALTGIVFVVVGLALE
ncbi:hypothetical protein [Halobellus rubicundus]|uniref:Uncharacterized protein n=1 Tax=Halobellus rubicundus TaxID=2996466 RepID=A0ABD5MKV6_9EURY